MPIYFEAEEINGTAYRWVLDDDMLDQVIELLGQPETIKA
jgi:hypothetical protein